MCVCVCVGGATLNSECVQSFLLQSLSAVLKVDAVTVGQKSVGEKSADCRSVKLQGLAVHSTGSAWDLCQTVTLVLVEF